MKNSVVKKRLLILAFGSSAIASSAQDVAKASASPDEFNNTFLWVYLGLIGVLVVVTLTIVMRTLKMYQDMLLKSIAKEQGRDVLNIEPEVTAVEVESQFKKIWYQLFGTGGQTIEQNKDIQINHPHDGIYELDNGMPPWLRNVFVSTIAFAIGYFWYYHSYLDGQKGQLYEYNIAVKEGEVQKILASEKQENSVSETNVVPLIAAADLASGQALYIGKCAVCHGQKGEGGVGPNMTDDYWIHGGDIKKVFSTIKYGVLEKGMIAWKDQLRPREIQELSSYILTLRGTNPPNPKAPQGELYKPEAH